MSGVLGVGIDIVAVGEFADQFDRAGTAFADNFTAGERRDADGPRGLASRWAAKEAVIKAWSVSRYARTPTMDRVSPRDIEVVTDIWGRPAIRVRGEMATHLHDVHFHISLTHDGDTAAAVAVMERLERGAIEAEGCGSAPQAVDQGRSELNVSTSSPTSSRR